MVPRYLIVWNSQISKLYLLLALNDVHLISLLSANLEKKNQGKKEGSDHKRDACDSHKLYRSCTRKQRSHVGVKG